MTIVTPMANGWRTDSMYTFSEAAHLAHVSPTTVRNWVMGYTSAGRDVQPLFTPGPKPGPMVSFLQLIEIVVAARFRKADGVPYQNVFRAYQNAREISKLQYPFAHYELRALGGHIVGWLRDADIEVGGSLQALDAPAQWTLPDLVTETLDQLDYEENLAARWYPINKNIPIVVDPRMSSGAPTIEGRGVTVQVVRKRFKAGQKIDFIARDFKVDQGVVEEVIRYGELVAA